MSYVRLCFILIIYKMIRLTAECNLKGKGGGGGGGGLSKGKQRWDSCDLGIMFICSFQNFTGFCKLYSPIAE